MAWRINQLRKFYRTEVRTGYTCFTHPAPMNHFYRVPVLTLLCMMLVVFALLYLQSRTTRRLLWLIGWALATLHLALEAAYIHEPGFWLAISNTTMVLSALMFLGSMSPIAFRRAPKILYAYAFSAPIFPYAFIISYYPEVHGVWRLILVGCAIASLYAAVLWGIRKRLLPPWFTVGFPLLVGVPCIWLTWQGEFKFVLYLVQGGSNLMTALLFAAAYRRLSPGVVFTSAGFFLWSTPVILDSIFAGHNAMAMMVIGRSINLVKVITAVGMIQLVLEDEVAQNQAAKERDHRARLELERYSAIDLSLVSDLHTETAYQSACEAITGLSRFNQAALFLRNLENNFRLVAHSGMESELVHALQALGRRFTSEQIEVFQQSGGIAVEFGNTFQFDLRSLLEPDDPLEQLGYTRVHAIAIQTRSGSYDGALILSGLKCPEEPLLADDLLPLELLVSRLAATRENNLLMQRIARSEKLAGLGQLASGVAHELNNPLTVVLGYSELLKETLDGHPARGSVSLIHSEAQRMHQIIESMLRFWKSSPLEPTAVSIGEILNDICRLRRPAFDRRKIKLYLHLPEHLPHIQGNKNHLQQVFLQVLNNALETFESNGRQEQSLIRIDVSHSENNVRILFSDNGPGFADPERVFDPFFTTKQPRAGTGMGLSVCYAIVRDHGGEMTAHNLEPQGALIVIELPTRLPSVSTAALQSIVQ
jgi:two-component system NtrC family sensor kinase